MSEAEQTAPATQGAPPGEARGLPRAVRWILEAQTAWIFVALLIVIVIFSILAPDTFATRDNFRNLAVNASTLLVVAVGMTFVIITGGIDLSVGAVLVFAGVVSGKAMIWVGGGEDATFDAGYGTILFGLVVALGAGLGWGLLNGIVITRSRVTPLIVTLGTLGMAEGIGLLITDTNIRVVPQDLTESIGIGRLWGQIPYLVLIAAVVTVVAAVALALTRFGRHTHALGSNAEASRRAGVKTERHLIKIYALSGMLAGLAGFMSLAQFSTTSIGSYSTENLQAIAAVVIGGTSLFGGVGTIVGTVVGVFIPVVLQNGFIIEGVQPYWQEVAVGGVLIAAVYLDQLKRRARAQG
jgi:ribose transport system permease protein